MLREPKNPAHKDIYIRPDLTVKQREESKNLRMRLKETRDQNPDKTYMIKNYKIIETTQPPGTTPEENIRNPPRSPTPEPTPEPQHRLPENREDESNR